MRDAVLDVAYDVAYDAATMCLRTRTWMIATW